MIQSITATVAKQAITLSIEEAIKEKISAQDIEYNDFVEYLQIVDMMLIEDIKELIDIFEQGKNHKYDYARCFRLKALGMLTGGITVYCGESQVDKFYLTDMGKGLCKYDNR